MQAMDKKLELSRQQSIFYGSPSFVSRAICHILMKMCKSSIYPKKTYTYHLKISICCFLKLDDCPFGGGVHGREGFATPSCMVDDTGKLSA